MNVLETIGFAFGLFIATHVDSIVVLASLFADPRLRPRDVWLGHLAAGLAMIAVGAAGSLLAFVVRAEFLGVLGVIPIVLGITQLIDRDDDDSPRPEYGNRTLGVAVIMIANGGDNLGAYVPAFATRSPHEVSIIVGVLVAMLIAWCWLWSRVRVGPRIRRVAALATPLVFVALGVLIFIESGALRLVMK
ncbi:MAG: cadmium resistance transporter [Kofleriaceae bacterium]